MADALLSIDTMIERSQISVDGALYEIVSPEELPLLTSQRIAALGRKLDKFMKSDDLNDTSSKQLNATLDGLVEIIMEPVPGAVIAKLSQAQKYSVIEVFTMLSLARKSKLAGATLQSVIGAIQKLMPAEMAAKIGESLSHGSSDFTAATK